MLPIEQGEFVAVNGVPHWLTLRSVDGGRPPLLVIGGPGVGYAALAPFFAEWERAFTVVQWDQPGGGFTYARSGAEPESVAALAADGVRVAELVCDRLEVQKVVLLGFSGGTIVALEMLRRRPELFAAYVGSGQIVDWALQDALSYRLLVARARESGSAEMLRELEAIGPPPYPDAATDALKSKYAGAPTPREAEAFAELMPLVGAALQGVPAGASYFAKDLRWPDPLARSLAAYTALRPEIVSFDARKLGLAFPVPMFFLQGAEDVFTVTAEVHAYAAEITAPHVELVLIPGAGHSALLLRHEISALLTSHVLPRL